MNFYRKKTFFFFHSIKGRNIKTKKSSSPSIVQSWRPDSSKKQIALKQLNRTLGHANGGVGLGGWGVGEGLGFISCGRVCICPRRPSPGWPLYWSSPHRSCCGKPEKQTGGMITLIVVFFLHLKLNLEILTGWASQRSRALYKH